MGRQGWSGVLPRIGVCGRRLGQRRLRQCGPMSSACRRTAVVQAAVRRTAMARVAAERWRWRGWRRQCGQLQQREQRCTQALAATVAVAAGSGCGAGREGGPGEEYGADLNRPSTRDEGGVLAAGTQALLAARAPSAAVL